MAFNPKICEECGKEFIPRCGTQRYCSGPHTTSCEVCGKVIDYICSPREKPKCCSQSCINERKRRTVFEKYGVDNVNQLQAVKDKISKKNSSEEVKEKRKKTCLERYGVDNVSKSEVVRKKLSEIMRSSTYLENRANTCMQRYGTVSPMQSDYVKSKVQQSNQQKYGVAWACQSERWKQSKIRTNLRKYGVPHYCMTDVCKASNGHTISKTNRRFAELLRHKGYDIQLDSIVLDRLSYDIIIKSTNILIEINPTYTHNSYGNHWNKQGLRHDYHLMKSKIAEKHGFRCIHVFDWDDWNKVINLFLYDLVIDCKHCTVKLISENDASEFETVHSLDGNCDQQSIYLGLYQDSLLIQVMVFGNSSPDKDYQWELLRLCTKSGYQVIGGFSKLFKYFIDNYSPQSIISYCDRSKFTGEVYETLGMKLHHMTEPAKIWSKGVKKVTDNLLRQRGFDQLFNTNYGKGTSNEKLMLEHGWLPVYDCGQAVYTWVNR